MSGISRAAGAAFALVACIVAREAYAQGESDAERGAEELFVRGRDAMLRGDYEGGCPLLAESQRRDPRLGVLFTLAECELRGGKGARAAAHYDAFLKAYARPEAARNAANDERQRIALTRKASLAARIAFVTLVVPTPRADGAALAINGEPVADGALGTELPVEPGDTTLTLTPVRGEAQRLRVSLAAGEHRTVMLAAAPASPAAPPAPVARRADTAPSLATTPSRGQALPLEATPTHRSPWIYAPGAIGVAALGAAAVTGVLVLAKKSDIDVRCPDRRCDAAGLGEVDRARTLGHVTTALAVGGAVGIASTVILLLVRPSASPSTAAKPAVRVDVAALPTSIGATVSGPW